MNWIVSAVLILFIYGMIIDGQIIPARVSYPQIISHRGASGYIPEHSLPAYQLAIDLKTDYIEPDLCLSKDGVFVAMHDLLLDDTTNVASFPEYTDRKTTKMIDGIPTTGYFISDFTYAELKSLRLYQRLTFRTKIYDGYFTIPSLDEIMSLARSSYNTTSRTIGLYVELKHPSYFKSLGFPMEDMLLTALKTGGYVVYGEDVPKNIQQTVVPIVIQCFESSTLQYLHTVTTLPLVQLLEVQTPSKWTKENIAKIATYAQGIGPDKTTLGTLPYVQAKGYVDIIHSYKLVLHPWTFRADSGIIHKFNNDFNMELMYFYCCLGMDGLFSEFPDRSRESIDMIRNYTLWTSPAKLEQQPCPIVCTDY